MVELTVQFAVDANPAVDSITSKDQLVSEAPLFGDAAAKTILQAHKILTLIMALSTKITQSIKP